MRLSRIAQDENYVKQNHRSLHKKRVSYGPLIIPYMEEAGSHFEPGNFRQRKFPSHPSRKRSSSLSSLPRSLRSLRGKRDNVGNRTRAADMDQGTSGRGGGFGSPDQMDRMEVRINIPNGRNKIIAGKYKKVET